jgi:hypothetical protein
MHERMTVDQLIEQLQAKKAGGLPGDTVVAVRSSDNNGRSGFASFELSVSIGSVAKAEFEKGWSLAKFVSRSGVQVLVVG